MFITIHVLVLALSVPGAALSVPSAAHLRHRQSKQPWWVDGSSLSITSSDMLCALRDAVNQSTSGVLSVSSPAGRPLPHMHTCAVVSSSGVLGLHEHGDAIDSADMVLRFNTAPIVGFEHQVGAKDMMRLVNEKILDEWNHGENVDYLNDNTTYATTCTVCNVGSANTVSPAEFEQRQVTMLQMYPNIELFASDLQLEPSLEGFFDEWYGIQESSAGVTTGGVGMVLALSMCDEVVAYGMAASANDVPSVPYSYWETASTDSDEAAQTQAWHESFAAEKDLWRQLATNPLTEVDASDIAVIPGFGKASCPANGGLI